ncbi:PD40 domain-containing protein [Candidatus Woesebacteria bacterium]|nr:PD40 domain-containing protein [Candidatus Woesebacteria bacterium]QQG47176.1 MAG: PD40 domain-containing protein [Candidatus Woesebacteria bacterium]
MKRLTILLILVLTVWGSLVEVPTNKVWAQEKVYRIAYVIVLQDSVSNKYSYYLEIVDPGGQNKVRIPLNHDVERLLWSPDHTKLAVIPACCEYSFVDFYDEKGILIKTYKPVYYFLGFTWFGNNNEVLTSKMDVIRGDGVGLFVQDLTKDSEYKVVSGSHFDTWNISPVVSPDGRFLAFVHQEFGSNNWVVVVKLDSSKYPYDYLDFHNEHVPKDYVVLDGPDLNPDLRWLSDSDTLLVSSSSNYLFSVSRKTKTELETSNIQGYSCSGGDVILAHTSKRIACWASNNSAGRVLLVSSLDGTYVMKIHTESTRVPLSWSPDDLMIVYECPENYQSGGLDMYTLCITMSDGFSFWKLHSIAQAWYSRLLVAW